jgi:hypothetical protein
VDWTLNDKTGLWESDDFTLEEAGFQYYAILEQTSDYDNDPSYDIKTVNVYNSWDGELENVITTGKKLFEKLDQIIHKDGNIYKAIEKEDELNHPNRE